MPRTLALMAAQRHTAASRSTRPEMRLQHGVAGGDPIVTFPEFSKSAHTPNLRTSIGQWACWDDGGGGEQGVGAHELSVMIKRRLRVIRREVA